MHRFSIFALFWAAMLLLPATMASATDYLSVADDVPLPAGFVEETDSAVIFDKPDGRLVETRAAGPGDRQSVAAFYLGSLPALGWAHQPGHQSANPAQTKLTFIRDQELLTLTIEEAGGARALTVTLEPLR